jgi:transcription antitermination factor NusG
VRDTRGVVRLVEGGCGPLAVADEEISAIKRVLDADLPVESVPWLQPGRCVRVVAGPLTGLEGRVEKQGRHGKLYIAVHTIGQTIAVQIDMTDVVAA